MRLHIPSVAVGAAALAVLMISSSLATTAPITQARIEYGPHPRDMVQIREGTPFVVPAGRLFVLTGLGTTFTAGTYAGAMLKVNGQMEAVGGAWAASPVPSGVAHVPAGFTAPSGAVLEVVSNAGNGSGRAWAYLSNP